MEAAAAPSNPRRTRRALPRLPPAALSSPSAVSAASTAVTGVVEKSTGLTLPPLVGSASLLATGVRVKRLVAGLAAVKVYAVGLYADATAAKRLLRGKPTVTPSLEDLPAATPRAVVLVFARNVSSQQVATGLTERLSPLLPPSAAPALAAFAGALSGGASADKQAQTLRRGDVVTIWLAPGGAVRVEVSGRSSCAAPVVSAPLAAALWRVYAGKDDPVVPALREAAAAALAKALA